MAYIHFILQGKGGVGKSLVASALIQNLIQQGIAVQGIDTDPVNATLGGYKEFSAKVFNIMDGDNINPRKFDEVLEIILNAGPDEHIVIDNGASSFIPLMSYLKENDAVSLIQENGHTVYLHTVVTGAEAVMRQAEDAQGEYGIPVDPDVAEYMGAFREDAINLDDMLEDSSLTVNLRREVVHE